MSSTNGTYDVVLNGGRRYKSADVIPYWRDHGFNAIMENCSLRLCIAGLRGNAELYRAALENQGRIEFQCRDRQLRSKGKFVLFDASRGSDTLPEWTKNGQCDMVGIRYVWLIEINEMWSTSPYRIQCGGNVAYYEATMHVEYIFQYNITGCPEGRYGLYCDKDCVCKNGARCHGFNGACECHPGWRGRACDIPWPEVVIVATPGDSVVKYIGTNLTLTCLTPHIRVANMTWVYQAKNDYNVNGTKIILQTISESANGEYICVVKAVDGEEINATFVLNATKCPPNYYGKVCSQVCDCQYGGTCDRWEGCLCPPGRRGDKCEYNCAPGSFGLNCSMSCRCQNNASCDPANGTCICAEGQWGELCQNFYICPPGLHGDRCDHTCAPGSFGLNCSMSCRCQNNAICNSANGTCTCAEGQWGKFCENVPKSEHNQVVVQVLIPVISVMVIVGCIVIVTLVRRRGVHTKNTEDDIEMETFSSWEIDKEDIRFEHMIGEGEFGHVVRGRLRVPAGYEVLVAAKCIRPDRITESAVRDFRREMDILARIHEDKEGHPNVVKFYGALTKSDPQYIVVEYAANEELRRYLWSMREECRVTGHRRLLERLVFAAGVANGLSELARLKIVHRDIAARNVVISDRKVAKIADFGLARDVYVSSAYKRTNQGGEEELLPLKWMAVESLRDGVYTCESDVWSCGVLLWEIASFGEEPRYAGGPMHPDVCTLLELLKKGVRLQQPENCPLSVYRIIRSCWIVDPRKRPTPEELLQKIDQLMPRRDAAHLVNHNISYK
ncbi:proto-oncogene tyrosine-protein kinase receptor Ret-like [Branchiostoma floridae]|uniref:receptor protein-tyrosine kinase n=1 Tax=Branchiostoma floridae TaxID=7739 RepID=A0A9J7L9K7_BRAFL|nr:proto-oncogene tyrosine-protein kinase receptor Ret-like [Branchiostoma floridae]